MEGRLETKSTALNLQALALVILCIAMFVLSAFQAFMLYRARQSMETARAAQEQPLQDGAKLRQSIEALAERTAELASEGDQNAKAIVENFYRQGIEMKPAQK